MPLHKQLFLASALCASALLPASFARAETTFSLGVGGVYSPDYEGSDDYEFVVIPMPGVEWENSQEADHPSGDTPVRFGLFGAGVNFMDGAYLETMQVDFGTHRIRQRIGVGYDMGRDEDDNIALQGLGDIDGYATGTIGLSYGPIQESRQFFTSDLSLKADLSGETNSITVEGDIKSHHMITKRLMIDHGPHIKWVNDAHNQAYFGISAAQAAKSVYSRYSPKGGVQDMGYDINASYKLTDHIGMFAGATYTKILGDAADSPLVKDAGSDDQFTGFLGMGYRF